MSLAIEVDDITAVLLADGWHAVADKSFTLDAYEFLWAAGGSENEPMILHGGGQGGVCATGFSFKETQGHGGNYVHPLLTSGPLTAILAVRRHTQ